MGMDDLVWFSLVGRGRGGGDLNSGRSLAWVWVGRFRVIWLEWELCGSGIRKMYLH